MKSKVYILITLILFISNICFAGEANTQPEDTSSSTAEQVTQNQAAIPLKIFGSVRYRFQLNKTKNELVSGTISNDVIRERQRIKAQLGFLAKPAKGIEVGFALTTPDTDSIRSHNQTLGNSMGTKAISILQAYFKLKPFGDILTLSFGKFKNPLYDSNFVFTGEVNPEGLNQTLSLKLSKNIDFGINVGEWVLLGDELNESGDKKFTKWVITAQPFIKINLNKIKIVFAPGFFIWTNKKGLDDAKGLQKEAKYTLLNVYLNFKFDLGVFPLSISFEWVYNFSKNEYASDPRNEDLKKKNMALQIKLKIGELKKLYDWSLSLGFRTVQRYAFDGMLSNDDFSISYDSTIDSNTYLSPWNIYAIFGSVGINFMPNTSFTIDFIYTKNKSASFDLAYNDHKYVKDLIFKFSITVKF